MLSGSDPHVEYHDHHDEVSTATAMHAHRRHRRPNALLPGESWNCQRQFISLTSIIGILSPLYRILLALPCHLAIRKDGSSFIPGCIAQHDGIIAERRGMQSKELRASLTSSYQAMSYPSHYTRSVHQVYTGFMPMG